MILLLGYFVLVMRTSDRMFPNPFCKCGSKPEKLPVVFPLFVAYFAGAFVLTGVYGVVAILHIDLVNIRWGFEYVSGVPLIALDIFLSARRNRKLVGY